MSFLKQQQIFEPVTNHTAHVTNFQDLITAERVRLVGTTFVGTTKDTNFWTEAVTGSGTVAQSGGEITLNTGLTANSTVQYQSVRTGRFIPAVENVARTVMRLGDTGTANNIRNWGAFDANNGAFFQLNGTTLNVVTRSGGSDTAVAKASWNVNNTFTLDTNYHSYEIHFSYVHIEFWIDNVLVHQISISGTLPVQTFTLPFTFQSNNSGGGTGNVNMIASLGTIFRNGKLQTDSIGKNLTTAATTVLKFGAGRLHHIVLNNPNLNTGTLTLFDNTAASGTTICTFFLPKNAALTPISVDYDIPFSIGLTAVTSVACDVTITYE